MTLRKVAAGALVFCSLALPSAALADHADPLVGQWHLDVVSRADDDDPYSTPDSSGHGYELRTSNLLPQVQGRFGNAIDPTLANYLTGGGPELRAQRLSLLAWVRSPVNPGPSRYVASQGGGVCAPSSYGMYTGASADGLYFYVRALNDTAYHAPKVPSASVWDGNWHMVVGTFDGSTARFYFDGAEMGSGTAVPSGPEYGLADNSFSIAEYASRSCVSIDTSFRGGIDETRVYNRALSATEIARLAAHSGPDPPTLVPDAPGGGGTLPSVTGVSPANTFVRDRSVVLTAQVSGAFRRLEWNLRGDNRPEIMSRAGQDSVRFRPRPGQFEVGVRAVGAAGGGPQQQFSFTAPPARNDAVSRKLRARVTKLGRVAATGTAGSLLPGPGDFNKIVCGTSTTVRFDLLEISGCMRPIESLDNIPSAERGILEPLAEGLDFKLIETKYDAVAKAISLTDGYIATGSVFVNGVRLRPQGGATIVIYPQARVIASSNSAFEAGGLRLATRRNFLLHTDVRRGEIPLGSFALGPGSLRQLGGFDLVGDVRVDVTPTGAEIRASLRVPEWLKVGGVDFQGGVRIRATEADGLVLDSMQIGPFSADLGGLDVENFRIDYIRNPPEPGEEWRGEGRACLIGGICLDMVPPNGGVVIKKGELGFAGATLGFPPPGVPLYPGLALERIGFGVGLNPTRVTGNAKVVALKVYEIDGRLVVALPTPTTPFRFDRSEVGDGFPPHFYGRTHTTPTVGITANASLRVPVIGAIRMGGGYFLYEYPGYVALGGGIDQDFAGILRFQGGFGGDFNASNGRFSINGHVRACVGPLCRGAAGVISSRGLAACLDLAIADTGVGVLYNPFRVVPYLWGCRWSPYAEFNVRGGTATAARNVRAGKTTIAQAGNPLVVDLGPGDPSRAIRLDGGSEAPRVRVSGPGGQVLESTAGDGLVETAAIRILRSEANTFTVVGLRDTNPGTYRIEALPTSAEVTKITRSEALPAARVRVRIRGRGSRRILAYEIARRPAQRVTFVELSAGGTGKAIGTVSGGGRGRLRFSSAPGHGLRRVEAQFELDGVPAEKKLVARFNPPSSRLGRPNRLRVRRRGMSLSVSWAGVRNATRYEVVATTSGAGQRIVRTRGRRATLKRIPKSSAGRVSVRAVATLRQGKPASARFPRTAKRKTRFSSMAEVPRRLR